MKPTPLREYLLARADEADIADRLAEQRILVLAAVGPRQPRGPLDVLRVLYRELVLSCRPAWAVVSIMWILTATFHSIERLDEQTYRRVTPEQMALVIAWVRLRSEMTADQVTPPPATADALWDCRFYAC